MSVLVREFEVMTQGEAQVADAYERLGGLVERLLVLRGEVDAVLEQIEAFAVSAAEAAAQSRAPEPVLPESDAAEAVPAAGDAAAHAMPEGSEDRAPATGLDEELAHHLTDFLGSATFGQAGRWAVKDMKVVYGRVPMPPPVSDAGLDHDGDPSARPAAPANLSFPIVRQGPIDTMGGYARRAAVAAGIAAALTAALLAIGQYGASDPRQHPVTALFDTKTPAGVLTWLLQPAEAAGDRARFRLMAKPAVPTPLLVLR